MRTNRKKTVLAIEQEDDDSESEDEVLSITLSTVGGSINMVKGDPDHSTAVYAVLQVNKRSVRFQLDCGATCNVIPANMTKGSNTALQSGSNDVQQDHMTPLGKCTLQVKNPCSRKKYKLKFIVVEKGAYRPILGSKACQEMQLINVMHQNIMAVEESREESKKWTEEQIKLDYADVFEGDGTFEGKLKLEIDEQVEPVKLPKRRVPTALYEPLKKELADLHRRGIIAPVERSSDWISSMVIVQKPSGQLRTCIDPKPLNKALKRNHYPLPTIEDVLPDLNGARVFSVCDVKNGFWHVELEAESSFFHNVRFTSGSIPLVFSDNGPQYSSDEFKKFSKPWDFTHKPSHRDTHRAMEKRSQL